MKNYHYRAHVTLEDGTTDSCTSPDMSDIIYTLGRWLDIHRVVRWKILKVFQNEIGSFELLFDSEEV